MRYLGLAALLLLTGCAASVLSSTSMTVVIDGSPLRRGNAQQLADAGVLEIQTAPRTW